MHQQSGHYQPRYRLVSHYPFQHTPQTTCYREHILEIGDAGVLVSPIGGDRYAMNGYYMLFVSVTDAQLFVDDLIAAVPAPPQHGLPTMYTEPLDQAQLVLGPDYAYRRDPTMYTKPPGQARPVQPPKSRPRYRLSTDDPGSMHRDWPRKWVSYRGYEITVIGNGSSSISHPEYGPYKMDGYYVIFRDEQAARDHIDSWFAHGHTISRA